MARRDEGPDIHTELTSERDIRGAPALLLSDQVLRLVPRLVRVAVDLIVAATDVISPKLNEGYPISGGVLRLRHWEVGVACKPDIREGVLHEDLLIALYGLSVELEANLRVDVLYLPDGPVGGVRLALDLLHAGNTRAAQWRDMRTVQPDVLPRESGVDLQRELLAVVQNIILEQVLPVPKNNKEPALSSWSGGRRSTSG